MPASRAKPSASRSTSPTTPRWWRSARRSKVDFVVVGPEAPLVAGIVDDLEAAGFRTFGPTKAAARLEGSKGFTKDLCRAHDIPTGAYERFTAAAPAKAYARAQGAPIVVKADGLAAGKGVIIARDDRRGRSRDRHDVRRRSRRSRRRSRDRGISQRRGGLLLRAVRRRDRDPARLRAGSQARLRRRQGAEHRRHGRLFAGAGDDADDARQRDHGRDRAADGARHEGDGAPVQGHPVSPG